MNARYAVRIHRRGDRFVATTALEKLASDPGRIDAQLRDIADAYARAVAAFREALADGQRGARGRGAAYWRAGQTIVDFENALSAAGFYLVTQNAAFARDLGMNAGTLRKIIAYRRRNPDVNALDATSYWTGAKKR